MLKRKIKPSGRCIVTLLLSVFCLLFFSVSAYTASDENDLATKIVLFPYRKAVIASRIDSVITRYSYKPGENFAKGASIVKLDSGQYRQILLKAEAALLEAETQLRFSEKVYRRNMGLYQDGALGNQELERSKLDNEIAKSKLLLVRANLKMARINVNFCNITAPFAGKLITKIIFEHEFVKTGQPVMEIIAVHKLLAFMHLPSSQINAIKTGAKMKFRIDETGVEHQGTVYEIAGVIDPGSRTFEVKAVLDNKNQSLAPGMSGMLIE
ncbi:efflux RND transporter periplasmic adaptor subunit [Desulfococcaceae bacterium HSG7]|nr:efflux RND transporter periplasmic adaptor subunit [Desulfococcaceae bacterium HSG7]